MDPNNIVIKRLWCIEKCSVCLLVCLTSVSVCLNKNYYFTSISFHKKLDLRVHVPMSRINFH